MTLLTCAAVRRRLPAFYDRELPIRELIAIEAHVTTARRAPAICASCRTSATALRLAAAPGAVRRLDRPASGVISRMRAEAHESWTRARRRGVRRPAPGLDWPRRRRRRPFVCVGAVLSMLHFASPERERFAGGDDRGDGGPVGSDLNPGAARRPHPGAERARERRRLRDARAAGVATRICAGAVGGRDAGRTRVRPAAAEQRPATCGRSARSSTRSRAAGSSRRSSAARPSRSTSCGSSRTRRSRREDPAQTSAERSRCRSALQARAYRFTLRHRRRHVVHRVGRADDHAAAASLSSSVTSNSSRRESGMPSFG